MPIPFDKEVLRRINTPVVYITQKKKKIPSQDRSYVHMLYLYQKDAEKITYKGKKTIKCVYVPILDFNNSDKFN